MDIKKLFSVYYSQPFSYAWKWMFLTGKTLVCQTMQWQTVVSKFLDATNLYLHFCFLFFIVNPVLDPVTRLFSALFFTGMLLLQTVPTSGVTTTLLDGFDCKWTAFWQLNNLLWRRHPVVLCNYMVINKVKHNIVLQAKLYYLHELATCFIP